MSTVEPTSSTEIKIVITESNIGIESDLSIPEQVFWIDIAKAMMVKSVLESDGQQ